VAVLTAEEMFRYSTFENYRRGRTASTTASHFAGVGSGVAWTARSL